MPLARTITDMRSRRTLSRQHASLSVQSTSLSQSPHTTLKDFPVVLFGVSSFLKKKALSFHGRNERKKGTAERKWSVKNKTMRKVALAGQKYFGAVKKKIYILGEYFVPESNLTSFYSKVAC